MSKNPEETKNVVLGDAEFSIVLELIGHQVFKVSPALARKLGTALNEETLAALERHVLQLYPERKLKLIWQTTGDAGEKWAASCARDRQNKDLTFVHFFSSSPKANVEDLHARSAAFESAILTIFGGKDGNFKFTSVFRDGAVHVTGEFAIRSFEAA